MSKCLTVIKSIIIKPILSLYTFPAVLIVFAILDQSIMCNLPVESKVRRVWEELIDLLMDTADDHWGNIAWHTVCVTSAAFFYTLSYFLVKKIFFD